jgi:hypothetical protein
MSVTTFTEGVQDSLAPWADPAGDWQAVNAALASMFEQVYGLVSDQGSPDEPASYTAGFSTLLDPTACPEAFLPFCGMFVGVVIPPGTDEVTARAKIIAEQNFQRGTGFAGSYSTSTIPAGGAIVAAAQRFLVGTQSVVLQERTAANGSADAYHFVLVLRPEEAQPTNGVLNPSLERDGIGANPTGWNLFGTNSLGVSRTEAFSGSQCVQAGYGNDLRLAEAVTATAYAAGETRTISAYIWVPAGWNGGQITLDNDLGGTRGDFTIDGVVSGPIDANMALRDQWQRLATAITAGGSGFGGAVFIRAGSAPTSGDAIFIDAVMETEGAILLPYFDGDTPGYDWMGTPGDSTSQKPIGPLIDAVNAVKPGGVQWTLVQTDAFTWSEAIHDWSADTMTWNATASTQP